MRTFLLNKYARIVSAVLVVQAVLFYTTSRGEKTPDERPLRDFPKLVSGWQMVQEGYVDDETQAVLKADDTLTRTYARSMSEPPPLLFVAFFKTQRTGKTPHSPKNCLPGAGWVQEQSGMVDVAIPGEPVAVRLNQYVVS